MSFASDTAKLAADVVKLHDIVHGGPEASVITEGGTIITAANAIRQLRGTVYKGSWAGNTLYAPKDIVLSGSIAYICAVSHTSGTFATDYATGYWVIYQSPNQRYSSEFSSLNAAFTALGTTPSLLIVDSSTILTTSVSRPSNIQITVIGQGQIALGDYLLSNMSYMKPEWFGARGDGVTDDTGALKNLFASIDNGSEVVFTPGKTYLYTPIVSTTINSNNGQGYLSIHNKTGVHIVGYGATIKNSFVVTKAFQGSSVLTDSTCGLYGVVLADCSDCLIEGLTYDGNRDTTYGTNVDGNEFYSAFAIFGGSRNKLLNSKGINCQGDGLSISRWALSGSVSFGYDHEIRGNYFAKNRRNNISADGTFGLKLLHNVIEDAGYGNGTTPQAGIDLEWEHATIPATTDLNILVQDNTFRGVMAGGNISVIKTPGVSVVGNTFTHSTSISAINISGTVNLPSANIKFSDNMINGTNSSYGVNITDYSNRILVDNNKFKCGFPLTVNSSYSSDLVARVSDNTMVGEGTYSIKVIAGETDFINNTCVNSSSGGGTAYLAYFRPKCRILGNRWHRNGDQPPPTNGLVVSNSDSVVEGNIVTSTASITHPFVFGDNNTPAYPIMKDNYYNSSLLPDLVSVTKVETPSINMASNTEQLMYAVPDSQEIYNLRYVSVSARSANSTAIIGTSTTPNLYMSTTTVDTSSVSGNLLSALSTTVLTDITPVFITPSGVGGSGSVVFALDLRYNRSSLYTSTAQFS